MDSQRVVGWLAFALQRVRGPLAGVPAQYKVSDAGVVHLTWRGGPTARQVAGVLVEVADPELPVATDGTSFHPDDTIRRLTVGEVPVVLHALDPAATDPARWRDHNVRITPDWSWPQPLIETGAAYDVVHWHVPPDPGGDGIATVVSLPSQAGGLPTSPEGSWVIDVDRVVPEHASAGTTIHRRRANSLARIRVKFAPPNWGVAEADSWLMTDAAPRLPALMAAVILQDRCIMRCQQGLVDGLRIVAIPHENAGAIPWSVIPAAVVDTLAFDERRWPPATLEVAEFAVRHYQPPRITLTATHTVPTRFTQS